MVQAELVEVGQQRPVQVVEHRPGFGEQAFAQGEVARGISAGVHRPLQQPAAAEQSGQEQAETIHPEQASIALSFLVLELKQAQFDAEGVQRQQRRRLLGQQADQSARAEADQDRPPATLTRQLSLSTEHVQPQTGEHEAVAQALHSLDDEQHRHQVDRRQRPERGRRQCQPVSGRVRRRERFDRAQQGPHQPEYQHGVGQMDADVGELHRRRIEAGEVVVDGEGEHRQRPLQVAGHRGKDGGEPVAP